MRVSEHDHDFYEVFWVDSGKGVHRYNGVDEVITQGTIRFIAPADVHGFYVQGQDEMSIVNVAFSRSVVDELYKRYGAELAAWPWRRSGQSNGGNGSGSTGGSIVHVAAPVFLELSMRVEAIAADPSSRVLLDGFLLELFKLLKPTKLAVEQADATAWPAWLKRAQSQFATPAHFATGVQGLSELAGVSPEHLSRTLQKVAGMTSTQLINQKRLAWAAGKLRFDSATVTEIALETGLENISYFIRMFKARYGLTPAAYRRQARGLLPGLME